MKENWTVSNANAQDRYLGLDGSKNDKQESSWNGRDQQN